MKTLVLAVLIISSGWCWGETDFNILADTIADTTILHDVKIIDEHLVITDSVIIERRITMWHSEDFYTRNNLLAKLVAIFVAGLVLLSLICHYLKNKNGTKLH